MPTIQAIRNGVKWTFMALAVLIIVTFAISVRHPPEIDEQLRAECRTKYAAAHNRGDSILADNWIPAPGLQQVRSLRHCSQIVPGRLP